MMCEFSVVIMLYSIVSSRMFGFEIRHGLENGKS